MPPAIATYSTTAPYKPQIKRRGPGMWNSLPTLQLIASISLIVGVIGGAVALAAGFTGSVVSNRIAHLERDRRDQERDAASVAIAEANARAEEAKAEAAKANERLQKSQEMRRLTIPQAEAITECVRRMNDSRGEKVFLRVAAVEDAEAVAYAKTILDILRAAGASVMSDESGFPMRGVQGEPHPTGLAFHCTSKEERKIRPLVARMAEAGLVASVHINDSHKLGPALLILRKPEV